MIWCSTHGKDELNSCKEGLRNSSFLVEKSFGLHEYRPIYRFEAPAVKAMRPTLTREFSFQLIWGFCTLPFFILEVSHSNSLLSLLHCDVHHGVEVYILEDENLEGMFSARLSSRNWCPNCLLEGFFSSL